ncbi:FkbM family methyltransferase [Agrococcus sp. ARC_14]|uniref:FkbM family methyltransferase n=1 Tax=Agrococcus sp. ARC_14 TaxID=2919927 RepID=UPI001F06796C|nr:FkbM family methyltransferase [Agrococcus sp. ARC_14]MCH1884302.1 FkbM family methyltransferase [Agrococcus sp. ARC_14]
MSPQDQRDLEEVQITVEGSPLRMFGYPEDHIFDRIKSRREPYEHDLLTFVHEVLGSRPSGVVVDVGANLGNHTVYFAAVMGREVIAVEPEPENLKALRKNIDANGIVDRVEVHAVAAWNDFGHVELEQQIEGNRGTFSALARDDGPIVGEPLDSIVGDQEVALVKIDVEGAEARVIEGALAILERWHPVLVVESHGPRAIASISKHLEPLGYRRSAVLGLSDNYMWVAPPETANEIGKLFNLETARKFQKLVLHNSDVQGRRLLALGEHLDELSDAVAKASTFEADAKQGIASRISDLTRQLHSAFDERRRFERQALSHSGAQSERLEVLGSALGEFSNVVAQGKVGGELAEERVSAELRSIDEALRLSDESTRRLGDVAVQRVSEQDARLGELDQKIVDVSSTVANAEDIRDHLASAINSLDDRIRESVDEIVGGHVAAIDEARSDRELFREQRDRVARAYAQLSRRYAQAHPGEWSTGAAIRGALGTGELSELVQEILDRPDIDAVATSPTDGTRELRMARRGRDPIRIGIASMPGREEALAQVLRILSPQADEVFVYLNNSEEVPPELHALHNVRYFTGPDLGDRGKFSFLDGFSGYYLTCDDDIAYARYHVSSIIDGIERYGRKAIVGWHGSLFTEEFEKFYESRSRKVLSFRFLRGKDTGVHLLGTGVCGFHTDTARPQFEEFVHPNMADAFLAIHAQSREIPMVVLAHQGGEAIPIDTPGSISAASLGKDERGKKAFDVAATVTGLIKEQMPWQVMTAEPVFVRDRYRVAIVGRTDRARWKKGGILKSCHLTREMLLAHGWDAYMADIETGDPMGLEGYKPDLVMVYVGDPERPDFARVIEIVESHAAQGRKVLVNLSDNARPTRHDAIVERMRIWGSKFPGRIKMMTFSAEAGRRPGLQEVSDNGLVVPIPKTLVYEDTGVANFSDSSAIFVGDIAKLSDASLIGGEGRAWIDGIRRAVPEAKIVGVRQYSPRFAVDLGIDEVWPFLQGREFVDRLQEVRVAVSAVKFATFEMVPVEVAALGIPTFYRAMPHSLSTYLGQSGIEVDSVEELESRLPSVYRDPLLWRGYSEAGRLRAASADFQYASASMIVELAAFIKEKGTK